MILILLGYLPNAYRILILIKTQQMLHIIIVTVIKMIEVISTSSHSYVFSQLWHRFELCVWGELFFPFIMSQSELEKNQHYSPVQFYVAAVPMVTRSPLITTPWSPLNTQEMLTWPITGHSDDPRWPVIGRACISWVSTWDQWPSEWWWRGIRKASYAFILFFKNSHCTF